MSQNLTQSLDNDSDAFAPLTAPADAYDGLDEWYAMHDDGLTDADLCILAEREACRMSTANIVAVGACHAVDAICNLFDPRPAA